MWRYAVLVVLLMFSLMSCGGESLQTKPPILYKEGEVLVKFRSAGHGLQGNDTRHVTGAKLIKKIGVNGIERVQLPYGISVEEAIQTYKADPDVEYAEPNYLVRASLLPNDARFGELWGLHNTGQGVNGIAGKSGADVSASEAWDILQSSSLIVAVIDSGADRNHPDLSGNLIAGYDFINGDSDPDDQNGHGTHVTGILGAVGNNQGGMSGVCWSVRIMPLKVLDRDGEGTIADIVEAIEYADQHNARIINMSFSGPDFSLSLYNAIAAHPDILFVAAAGNGGDDSRGDDADISPEYPAGFDLPNIISVAATDQNDNLAYFSNFGKTSVDVAAPGGNILGTIPSYMAAVTYSGVYRLVYLAFGFESINTASARNAVMQKALDFEGIVQGDRILVIDDDGGDFYETYYAQALQTLGYAFDLQTIPLNSDGPDISTLNQYKLLIWFTGRQFRNTITSTDQLNLQLFLNNGGRLFVSGQDIGYDIATVQEQAGPGSFYQNYFHALYITDDAIGTLYRGQNVFNTLSADIASGNGDGAQYTRFVDALIPLDSESGFFIDYEYAYAYLDGTSMAAPFVAGIAALVGSQFSTFSIEQIKGTILGSVDVLSSLQGRVLTNGRVNAHKALNALMPPTNLNAKVQAGTSIVLTWTDNSAGEDGFRIEREESGGEFAEIASVNANQTTYTDSGLVEGVTYSYKVKAYNSAAQSAYSNESQPVRIPDGNGGGGGGGGGCSVRTAHNTETAIADTLILFVPAIIIFFARKYKG